MINRHKHRTRNGLCVRPSYKDTRNPMATVPEPKYQITKGGDRDRSAPGQQAGSETDRWWVVEAFSRTRMQRCWGPAEEGAGRWVDSCCSAHPAPVLLPCFPPRDLRSLIPCARSKVWPSAFPIDGPVPVTFSLLRIEHLYWNDINMRNIWSEYIP